MRVALTALALLALTGCGFKPMYAPSTNGGTALIGPVSVPEVRGKAGHAFRTEFTRLLEGERTGGEMRRIEIGVSEQVVGLGLRVDESSSRSDLILSAGYKFFDSHDRELFRGGASVTVSYDLPGSAYASAAAQDDARERAGVLLAERVRTDIAIRLTRLRDAPSTVVTPTARAPEIEPVPVPGAVPAPVIEIPKP